MQLARTEFRAGLRASLPLLIAVGPFGLVTDVAMAAGSVLHAGTAAAKRCPKRRAGQPRLLAGIVAIAWRFRVTFGTIIAGLAALQLFDWMF